MNRMRTFVAWVLVASGMVTWGAGILVAVLGRPVPPAEILRAAFIVGGCPFVLGMALLMIRFPERRRRRHSSLSGMVLPEEEPLQESRAPTRPRWRDAAVSRTIVFLLVLLTIMMVVSLALAQAR